MRRLSYKGYEAIAEYDAEQRMFHGDVINTRDVITFQAAAETELDQALAGSVEDYLAFCSMTKDPS